MIQDYHVHSCFSYDSEMTIAQIAEQAKQRGLTQICITDHLEFHPAANDQIPDFCTREVEIDKLHGCGVKILNGVEASLLRKDGNKQKILESMASVRLDFIIGSVHYVGLEDLYQPEYHQKRGRQRSVSDYVEEIALLIKEVPYFNVIGHFDYPQKCPHYPGGAVLYSDAPDAFDEIFKFVVQNGMGIEINTSPYRQSPNYSVDIAILKRYRELGGEIITIGSDAHKLKHIGLHCDTAVDVLKTVGFKYICSFMDLKPSFIKI